MCVRTPTYASDKHQQTHTATHQRIQGALHLKKDPLAVPADLLPVPALRAPAAPSAKETLLTAKNAAQEMLSVQEQETLLAALLVEKENFHPAKAVQELPQEALPPPLLLPAKELLLAPPLPAAQVATPLLETLGS